MTRQRIKVFFDGGCRPNPGPIEVAAVVRGRTYIRDDLGSGTSHDAEWLALIHALTVCQALNLDDFVLIGDALAVVAQARQALAMHQCEPAPDECWGKHWGEHWANFIALAGRMPKTRVRWIKSQQNLAGIALAARHPR